MSRWNFFPNHKKSRDGLYGNSVCTHGLDTEVPSRHRASVVSGRAPRDSELLLDVWRATCSHAELGEALQQLAAILEPHLPIETLRLFRFDRERSELQLIAGREGGFEHPPERRSISAAAMKRLVQWAKRGEADASPEILSILAPEHAGHVLCGPLSTRDGPIGAFLAAQEKPRARLRADLFQAVLEPLSVALENVRLLAEAKLRTRAAEEERSAVLTKFGRETSSDTIIGADGDLAPVIARLGLVATSDLPVLILGETGSGKEVIARAIHNRSNRPGAFIRVNCGAIPSELIDSELFGHEKGSFTGATTGHQGWFERADRGTLFLDEVAELSLPAQVRLLRILQDGSYQRVGGETTLNVEVRVLAATHRDLPQLIAEGKFREDLWYRIAAFPIRIPPLRQRPRDIPPLVHYLALRSARRFGFPPVEATEEDIALLKAYAWPGNVRELVAVIDRASILGEGRKLEVSKALGIGTDTTSKPPAPRAEPRPVLNHIESALQEAKGRVEGPFGAARILNMNPNTLRGKIRRLGIDVSIFRERYQG